MVDVAVGLAVIALLYAFAEALALGKVDVYMERDRRKKQLSDEVGNHFREQFAHNEIEIGGEENVQRFIFKAGVLFQPAKAGTGDLVPGALPMLQEFGRLLRAKQDLFNEVIVEGHTDERPISSAAFPSNWELSAMRAVTVVHIFTDDKYGVQFEPSKVYAAGYGPYRPLAAERGTDHPDWSEARKEQVIYSRDRRIEVAVYYSISAIRKAMEQKGVDEAQR
jgi:chemotaxis protein MotB